MFLIYPFKQLILGHILPNNDIKIFQILVLFLIVEYTVKIYRRIF